MRNRVKVPIMDIVVPISLYVITFMSSNFEIFCVLQQVDLRYNLMLKHSNNLKCESYQNVTYGQIGSHYGHNWYTFPTLNFLLLDSQGYKTVQRTTFISCSNLKILNLPAELTTRNKISRTFSNDLSSIKRFSPLSLSFN